MSFFPVGFDPRAEVVAYLDLVEIDTDDGPFGFLLGIDGKFTSTDARVWWGCSIAAGSDLEMAIGGAAPSGNLRLSFFQDPDAPDLVAQVHALGLDYVKNRPVRFYMQPLLSLAEFYAPSLAPLLVAQRTSASLSATISGPLQRSLSLGFEGPFLGRNSARGLKYTTEDHAILAGAANPSLAFMPSDMAVEEKLFG